MKYTPTLQHHIERGTITEYKYKGWSSDEVGVIILTVFSGMVLMQVLRLIGENIK